MRWQLRGRWGCSALAFVGIGLTVKYSTQASSPTHKLLIVKGNTLKQMALSRPGGAVDAGASTVSASPGGECCLKVL
jgi:hypothetical protein